MTDYVSYLLESDAAKRRLAEQFEAEPLRSVARRSTAIVAHDQSRAARTTIEKNNNTFQENRRERTPVRSRTRSAIPTIGSSDTKRDLTVSSFMLALVLVGVVVAAHTDDPVFWLLVGPTPIAVLHTTRTFLRQRVIRREGPLMFWKRDQLYQETLLTKNTNPIDATSKRLHTGQIVNT